LFLIKFIEQWGTGTNRIIEECLNHGLPEPLLEEISGSLIISFRKYVISDEILEKLNERQKKAIDYMRKYRRITSREYVELFSVTDRTARNDLKSLVDREILIQKGTSKKSTYYELLG